MIDPKTVPSHLLHTGAAVPSVGLGTFGSDKYSPDQVAEAVIGAARTQAQPEPWGNRIGWVGPAQWQT